MNKKIKITYLLLGLGIGIIFTSTLYSFYPKIEYVNLSDDIIIEKARELGMVSLKETIDVVSKEEVADENIVEIEDEIEEDIVETMEKIEESIRETIKEAEENIAEESMEADIEMEIIEEIEIIVESGSSLTRVAKKLYKENLIEDVDEFILFVKGKKLDKKIVTGKYKIKLNSTYDEIIETLTKRPK